jgi:hypothetical protein
VFIFEFCKFAILEFETVAKFATLKQSVTNQAVLSVNFDDCAVKAASEKLVDVFDNLRFRIFNIVDKAGNK